VIAFLFAVFHGFFLNLAPPGVADARLAVGFGSVFSLFILLFIAAVAKNLGRQRSKRIWLGAAAFFFAVAVGSSYFYKTNLDRLTFEYPPGNQEARYIAGTELTNAAKDYSKKHPEGITSATIVADFQGLANIEMVWTADSIRKAKSTLMWNYLIVVLSSAAMLFSLTEGILVEPKRK
jgi:hypothetical protein